MPSVSASSGRTCHSSRPPELRTNAAGVHLKQLMILNLSADRREIEVGKGRRGEERRGERKNEVDAGMDRIKSRREMAGLKTHT